MSQGYFKVDRSIFDNPIWNSEPFTKAQAWVDLFGKANHSDGYFFKRGIKIDVKRGQTGRSERTLALDWKWSRGKVKRFLNWLEKEEMVELKQDHKTSIITICNYESFQGSQNDDSTTSRTTSRTTNEPQTDLNNNVKKVKKNNKTSKVFDDECIEMKISKYLYAVLLKSDPDLSKPNFQNWCKDIDNLIRVKKRKPEDIQTVINYAHDPANSNEDFSWIPNLRSPKKLIKHFTTILLQCNGPSQDDGSEQAREEYEETQRYLNE